MNFLQNAIAAVQRNAMALLMYAVGILLIQSLGLAADYFLMGGWTVDPEMLTPRLRSLGLAIALCQAPVLATVTAVAFARIGKEMDRPLWRSPDDWDALRRFLQLWLLLILANTALRVGIGVAKSHESSLVVPLGLSYLLLYVLSVPVGACVMFAGALQWKDLGRNLAPLAYQFPRTLLLCFLLFMQLMMTEEVMAVRFDPKAGYQWLMLAPVVTVIGAYIDCLVFAGAWLMCIEHRNSDRDTDFEF